MARIFISLTSEDAKLADALSAALTTLLGESIDFAYSTSTEYGRGPKAGSDWFKWIVDQVRTCDFCLVLLTPRSVQKPWLLWESGAVYSAASATGVADNKVRPLLFQVTEKQLPSPFRDTTLQYQRGDTEEQVKKVFREIVHEYRQRPDSPVSTDRLLTGMEKLGDIVRAYVETVRGILLRAASTPTEVAIQVWVARLDRLISENRRSEVIHLQDWIEIAFGTSSDDERRPIDFRLHSRLADAYLSAGDYPRAIEQLELARQLAPRDIYVLRTLGTALLKGKHVDAAHQVLDRIRELDPRSFERNAECAALLSRYYRSLSVPDLTKARDTLRVAFTNDPSSHYLANLLGETSLEMKDLEGARDAFRRALEIINSLREDNIWIHATAANSAFVLGDYPLAVEYLGRIAAHRPDESTLQTIEGGLRTVASRVSADDRLGALLDALRPERVQSAHAYDKSPAL